ncbi:lipopolysaccharide biosynthesis protein [Phycisphaerales bacterium AB-hyl4]|uniref:Lipopolysaccharide biosynthesis protein n=1 Tax=Natronomicrosphaera hydrolytica TaxID=3242702 RepID=A0ABV4U5M6_9BACT
MKRNFAWALAGNVVYGASLWLSLVILAKLTSAADVGRFALAMAICTPIAVFSSLNLRSVQVTDAREEHRFGHLLGLQLAMTVLAMALIVGIAVAGGHDTLTAWLIVVVGLGQMVIMIRDVFLAFSQKHERMDQVAQSKIILSLGALVALGTMTWATGNVLIGVLAMQLVKLGVFLLWDLRATGRLVREYVGEFPRQYFRPHWKADVMLAMAWLALPLGVTALLMSLSSNVPRYYIAAFWSEAHLGYFAAILTLVQAGRTAMHAGIMSSLPRLSRYYLDNRRAYLTMMLKLIGVAMVLGAGGIVVAAVLGQRLLAVVFTAEYAAYGREFVWAMVYGMLVYVVLVLHYGMTAMRRFKVQPFVLLASLLTVIGTGFWLVPDHGLIGAIWALILAKLVEAAFTLLVIVYELRRTVSPAVGDIVASSAGPIKPASGAGV